MSATVFSRDKDTAPRPIYRLLDDARTWPVRPGRYDVARRTARDMVSDLSIIAVDIARWASAPAERMASLRFTLEFAASRHVLLSQCGKASQGVKALRNAHVRAVADPLAGAHALPWVYVLAEAALDALGGELDEKRLVAFVDGVQARDHLTVDEAYLLPCLLRVALLRRVHALFAPAPEGTAAAPILERAVASLHALEHIAWRRVSARICRVDTLLRADPSGDYDRMDEESRASYRRAVTGLARQAGIDETALARCAVARAEACPGEPANHVGHHLIAQGRFALVADLASTAWRRALYGRDRFHWRLPAFLGAHAVMLVMLSVATIHAAATLALAACLRPILVGSIVMAASCPAVWLVNAVAGRLVRPRRLPRLDPAHDLPDDARTVVVVPCVLADPADVERRVEHLHMVYLSQRATNLRFALLTDLPDAATIDADHENALVERAAGALDALNARYADAPFHLLHRARRWHPREKTWTGFERKRGKLCAFNRYLLRGESGDFTRITGDTTRLRRAAFVVTLDSDTEVPYGAVARLVATLRHPLNRPRFDITGTRLVGGHAILQPRLGCSLLSDRASGHARLFAGESGMDPYTRASSDLYHDLFEAGSYLGKGIYDVAAFDRLVGSRFPTDRVLSHDLLEGGYARSTLVSDVDFLEAHPDDYRMDLVRRLRWIRGDWQVAAWLGWRVPGECGVRRHNELDALTRWKILDNLRRSLVAPCMIASLAVLAWVSPPLAGAAAMAAIAVPIGHALCVGCAARVARWNDGDDLVRHRAAWRPAARALLRDVCRLSWLPVEAVASLVAVFRALWRMTVSRRHLLEWVASEILERRLARGRAVDTLVTTSAAPAIALSFTLVLAWSTSPATLVAWAPLFSLWLAAPPLALALSHTWRPSATYRPGRDDTRFLRDVARRTWAFFEDTADAGSNNLPPDNHQVGGTGQTATRTSCTNIGLGLLASLAAHDLGYLTTGELLTRAGAGIRSIARLDRYAGHLYNWYDTRSLQALEPRYVSTVDSGNFVVHLRVFIQGLMQCSTARPDADRLAQGLRDTLDTVREQAPGDVDALSAALDGAAATGYVDLANVARKIANDASTLVLSLEHAERQDAAHAVRRVVTQANSVGTELDAWRDGPEALERHRRALVADIVALCQPLLRPDFTRLYDEETKLFSIGIDPARGRPDLSRYDMLASEARIAIYLAVAMRQVPADAWYTLARTQVNGSAGPSLLSWTGSMFEYLMPSLVMPTYSRSLLEDTTTRIVREQIDFTLRWSLPWGVSECGYGDIDPAGSFGYKAFGIPVLALQPECEQRLVVAPYASALALLVDAPAAIGNLRRLAEAGLCTAWGFYEAVDVPPAPGTPVPVTEFMAHHQGMSLLAFAHVLEGPLMRDRFLADPELRAASLLLREKVPEASALHRHALARVPVPQWASLPRASEPGFVPPRAESPHVREPRRPQSGRPDIAADLDARLPMDSRT